VVGFDGDDGMGRCFVRGAGAGGRAQPAPRHRLDTAIGA
jgi:hypothetical protein